MMTVQEYKDELIPVNMNNPMRREDYYKVHMDKGITVEDSYEQLLKCETFTNNG